MGQDKKTPIVIDDVEYAYEDLTQEQQELFKHCIDLDRKIGSTQFTLVQLSVNKEAFIKKLKDSLES
jgi:cell division septum initiation protein DivIVA